MMAQASGRKRPDGFSLIELLVVIVILGILAAVVVFAVGAFTDTAGKRACATEAAKTTEAAESIKATTNGGIPSMNQMKGTPVAPETMSLNGISFTATLKSSPKGWDGDTTAPVAVNNTDSIAQFVYDPSTGQVTKDNQCA